MKPVHPGKVLKEELEARGLSGNALALDLHVPANRITAILNGKRGISADTALRLGRYFGTAPQFWINLQSSYDLALAASSSGETINDQVRPAPAP